MDKRANHQGSIRQRKDGTWEGRIAIGGTRHSRYGRSKDEVEAKLRELQVGVLLPVSSAGPMSLDTWVTRWLAERDLRPSALATYQSVLRPILSDLGHVTLGRLNPPMLALQFSLLKSRGMGARRLQLAHGYLRGCLERAVDLDYLPANPMARVQRPKWEPLAKSYWTPDQAHRFIQVAAGSNLRYARLFLLLATTGVRISEGLGLEPQDVDLVAAHITMRQAQVWQSGTRVYVRGPIKTKAGRRTLAVPEVARVALEEIPFRTREGAVPVPNTLKAVLVKLCDQAGVPPINPHGLRHVHAALAYRATGDAYAVQKRLGHSSVTTTMGIYGFGMGREEEMRDALDRLMPPGVPEGPQPPSPEAPPPQP
jgi:integrase